MALHAAATPRCSPGLSRSAHTFSAASLALPTPQAPAGSRLQRRVTVLRWERSTLQGAEVCAAAAAREASAPAVAAAAAATAADYLIVNFYHLSDVSDPEQVGVRPQGSGIKPVKPHIPTISPKSRTQEARAHCGGLKSAKDKDC